MRGAGEAPFGRQAARARGHVFDVGVVVCSPTTTTARSRPRSPARWTGGAAGMRRGACRPPRRSPRPANGWAGRCFRSCSNAVAARSPGRPVRPPRSRRWAPRGGRSCAGGGCWAIDGFDIDLPDSAENAAEFGYAGAGRTARRSRRRGWSRWPSAAPTPSSRPRSTPTPSGRRPWRQRLYPRLRGDELLTADRGFYSWDAWDTATATGAALLWRAPTQLDLPVVRVLDDGTYLTVLIKPTDPGAAPGTAAGRRPRRAPI